MKTMLLFEWDPAKARANREKHGVTFEDAMHVFEDPLALFESDLHEGEVRWRVIGVAGDAVVLLVIHTAREDGEDEVIRLISARRATRRERRKYDEASAQDA